MGRSKEQSDIARNAAAAAKDVAEAQHIDVRTKLANAELTDKLSANADPSGKAENAKELTVRERSRNERSRRSRPSQRCCAQLDPRCYLSSNPSLSREECLTSEARTAARAQLAVSSAFPHDGVVIAFL
jgi:hypothetical protein